MGEGGRGGCSHVHAPCLGTSFALQHPRLLPEGQHTMGAAWQQGNRVQRRGEGVLEERRRHV